MTLGDFERVANELIRVKEENEELKKQLEEYKNSQSCSFVNICKSTKIANYYQQKEFIKYLEDEIKKEKYNLEKLCELYKIPKEGNATYKFAYSYISKMEEILQKYKSIIEDDKQ